MPPRSRACARPHLPLYAVTLLAVFQVSTAYEHITTVAGWQPQKDDGVPVRFASFRDPYHIAVRYNAAHGGADIWIADAIDNRVRVLASNGSVHTVVGTGASGNDLDGMPGRSTRTSSPYSVAVLPAEDTDEDAFNSTVWYCDTALHRIRKVTPDRGVEAVAGLSGSGFNGDGLAPTSTYLASPSHMVVRRNVSTGIVSMWIADTGNNRIRFFSEGGNMSTVAGTDDADEGVVAVSSKIVSPTCVRVTHNASSGGATLWIVDAGHFRVRRVGEDGIVHTVVGSGVRGNAGIGGPATSAQLQEPYGLAVVAASAAAMDAGNVTLYIADAQHRRVYRVDVGGNLSVAAGNGANAADGDGLPATDAPIGQPCGVTAWYNASSAGTRLWITDSHYHRVRHVDEAGILSTVAGADGTVGNAARVPAAWVGLRFPVGVAALQYAAGGVGVWYADTMFSRIRRVDADGFVTTVGGTGVDAHSGDGGNATDAAVGEPRGIAVVLDSDDAVTVYFSQPTHKRVRRIRPNGTIDTVVGTGLPGHDGDGGAATAARIDFPYGVTAHRDEATGGVRLWISDYTSHTVRHVDAAGTISTIAGTPNLPGTIGDGDAAQNAQLYNPAGIAILFNAVTGGFRVWIAELEGHRVRHVSEGGIITTVAGTGSSSHSGDGGFAINAGVVRPSDVAVTRSIIDGQPVLWIVEAGTGVVRCVASDGRISTAAGNPTVSTFGDGGPPQAANMRGITGIAVLEDATTGNVTMWLADTSNHRIRRVVVGYVVDTLVGGLEGGGPATYARLAVPSDVAVLVNDTTGGASLWIADRDNNCIRHVSEAGIITRVAGGVGIGGYVIDGARAVDTRISEPRSIAVRRNASTGGVAMWIVAHGDGRVCYVSEAGLIYTVAGSGISTNLGDGWPATSAYLAQPSSVDVVRNETDGRVALWITTLADHRVRAVNSSGIIGTVVGDSAAALPAREARLSSPTGLAVYINATTGSVQFWIAERSGNRIRHVSTAGIISTTAGTGTAGAAGNGGLAVRAKLSAPFAVAFTRNAMTGEFTVWFTESANGLVRRVTPDGIISIVAGGGVPGIRGDDGPAVSAYLSSPRGLGVLSVPDADGLLNTSVLFIAESLPSKRIRRAVVGDAITTYAGGDTDGAPAAAVRMDTPADVHASLNATTQSADVWIVDSVQHVLRRLSPEGILFTVAGTGDVGFAGDGGPAKAAQLNAPVAVSVLFNESLGAHIAWVADSQNSRVRMVVVGGNISTAVGGGTDLEDDGSKVGTSFALARPVAVASVAGSSGGVLLWIVDADLQTVYHVNEDGFIARIAGQYLLGGTTGDGGPALQAQLKNPADVAVLYSATTGARRVWIADTGNLRVRCIAEDGTISTVAGGGSAVGTGNGGPATAARLTNPTCVTVSLDAATGDPVLWISESSANRVRRVTTSDGIISTFAGAGTVTTPLRGDGGQAYYAFVYRPQGVAVVRNAMTGVDMVWIAETGGTRIRFVQENNATPTPSVTASTSPSMSRTPSTTRTPSATASISVSATPSTTVSLTPSATTSSSVSATPSATATTSPSSSATPSASMVRASPPPNRGVVSYIIRV